MTHLVVGGHILQLVEVIKWCPVYIIVILV